MAKAFHLQKLTKDIPTILLSRRSRTQHRYVQKSERVLSRSNPDLKRRFRANHQSRNNQQLKIRTSRLSYHPCRLSSYGTCPKVMRRHIAEARRFTHLHANRLIGIRHTTGYGTTSRPESHNVVSTHPRAETFLRHFCNRWYHPARHLHLSLNHLTSECRMYH